MAFKLPFTAALCVFVFSCQISAQSQPELMKLYKGRKYFELKNELNKNNPGGTEALFYKGAVCNKFNSLDSAALYLEQYAKSGSDPELLAETYSILADTYVKTFQYEKSAEASDYWLANYSNTVDSAKLEDIVHAAKLWKACSSVPPQEIIQKEDVGLKITRDIAGLMNLPVVIGTDTVSFIFDTGANVSTISRTYAKKLNLLLMNDSLLVGAITGNKVYIRPGVAPLLKIGSAEIRNAIFLVMDDAALSFPQANYQINGIIGFPIIEGFGEFTIFRNDSIHIPADKSGSGLHNMALEELTPYVIGKCEGKDLYFSFDTGARSTILYSSFYNDFEETVKANSEAKDIHVGGAGGVKQIKALEFSKFQARIGGKDVTLNGVSVLTENMLDDADHLSGNLGQDVIAQFDSMTLNFKTMSLIFK